jgi:hypothetical protein
MEDCPQLVKKFLTFSGAQMLIAIFTKTRHDKVNRYYHEEWLVEIWKAISSHM